MGKRSNTKNTLENDAEYVSSSSEIDQREKKIVKKNVFSSSSDSPLPVRKKLRKYVSSSSSDDTPPVRKKRRRKTKRSGEGTEKVEVLSRDSTPVRKKRRSKKCVSSDSSDSPPPVRKKRRSKKCDSSDSSDFMPVRKRRRSKKCVSSDSSDSTPPVRKKRRSKKCVSSDSSDSPPPVRKKRRSKKCVSSDSSDSSPVRKKTRKTRRSSDLMKGKKTKPSADGTKGKWKTRKVIKLNRKRKRFDSESSSSGEKKVKRKRTVKKRRIIPVKPSEDREVFVRRNIQELSAKLKRRQNSFQYICRKETYASIELLRIDLGEHGVTMEGIQVEAKKYLTNEVYEEFEEDMKNINVSSLSWHFPREGDGRYPLNRYVLLRPYTTRVKLLRDRSIWLALKSPSRRNPNEQIIKLVIEPLIPEHHKYSWFECPFVWYLPLNQRFNKPEKLFELCMRNLYYNRTLTELPSSDYLLNMKEDLEFEENERLGVTSLDYSRLGIENFDENVSFFKNQLLRTLPDSENFVARVSLSILYQDNMQFVEAFDLFNIKLSTTVQNCLLGTSDDGKNFKWFLEENLRRSAPWKFDTFMTRPESKSAASDNNTSIIAKEYKKWRRLLQMPHQTGTMRYAFVLKAETEKNKQYYLLDIVKSPWWVKESEFNWMRAEEIDLKRYKLITLNSTPGPHCKLYQST